MHHSFRAFIALVALALSTGIALADPGTTPGKTGEMALKFTERSPLSALKTLAQRLGRKKLEPDYNLAEQEFLVWVADDYTPAKPQGIFLLYNYKESASLPESILPILKERHLIFITPRSVGQETWVKVGLGLDGINNLKKYYAVDPNRIYVFDFDTSGRGEQRPSAGELLYTRFADVVTADFCADPICAWRPLRAANGANYPAKAPAPPPEQVNLARNHPLVLGCENDYDYRGLSEKFLKQQGFSAVKRKNITNEDYHYPLYTTPWIIDTLTYFDEHAPKPKAAPAGTTRPATTAAPKPSPAPAAPPKAPPAAPKPAK